MNIEDLKSIATKADLLDLQNNLLEHIKEIVKLPRPLKKETYTPKEVELITGMSYSSIVKQCQSGRIEAAQQGERGSWLIPRSEIDKIIGKQKKEFAK